MQALLNRRPAKFHLCQPASLWASRLTQKRILTSIVPGQVQLSLDDKTVPGRENSASEFEGCFVDNRLGREGFLPRFTFQLA
jgi:hypothetical protein